MTYKEKYPKIVERDREAIKDALTCVLSTRQDIINNIIEALLEDAFYRGTVYGTECVVDDPGYYDLYAREE